MKIAVAVVSSTPERTILQSRRSCWAELARVLDTVNPPVAAMIRQQAGTSTEGVAQVRLSNGAAQMVMRLAR